MSSSITITGNLISDPELRFTPAGHAVCNFTVAVNERRKNAAGEWEDLPASFYNVAVWRQPGQIAAASLGKGDRVVVLGVLRLRGYERPDGSKGTAADVTAFEVAASMRWSEVEIKRQPRHAGPAAVEAPAA